MILLAAMIGQTADDSVRVVLVLSEHTKKAQARAMIELRANQKKSEPRIIAQYQLENERLRERIRILGVATNRDWSLTAGTSTHGDTTGADGFASVPPTRPRTEADRLSVSLDEVRRENFLLKGQLRDGRCLRRQARQLYPAEYPIRYQLGFWGVR
jgi:hypothetical protein